MKILVTLKTIVVMALFPSILCIAAEVPSNSLQVEYKKNSEKQTLETNLLSFDTVYLIPSNTYNYLDEVFTSFYKKISFNCPITESTFKNNSHYELVSIPLIAENEQGIRIELFGNFSDPATQGLSNVSEDQTLSNYYSNTELLNIDNSELSVGAGFRFNTSSQSKVKVIISNNNMPGYGNSNVLLGFETSF